MCNTLNLKTPTSYYNVLVNKLNNTADCCNLQEK
jgi:hypothetical protein